MYVCGVERELLNQEEFTSEPGVEGEHAEWQSVFLSDPEARIEGSPLFSRVTRLDG